MDFLDPRRRRAHAVRLMIGYGLMSIAIGLGAVILVYGAYGYGINTKTGDIIQNGLLFVDSQPSGADIYLNNQYQNAKTGARLVLPAGSYKLTIKKTGYRTWERSFILTEHSIARYVYPYLFPLKPQPQSLKTYSSTPPLISQSPDQRWLLAELPDSATGTFDEYDTTNPLLPPKGIAIPPNLLTKNLLSGSSLKEVEWSSDNKHLLLQHDYQGGSEFIIFNRDIALDSANINRLFNIAPTRVSLRDKKINQLYVFNQADASLQIADTANSTITPLLTHILDFKPSGSDLVTYITDQNSPPGQVSARIWDGVKSYLLSSFSSGSQYLINLAQFQSHYYYVAGSNETERLNIFKDPLSSIKNPAINKAIPMVSLNIKDATNVSFSNNTRFIAAQAGQNLALYDIENQNAYHYTLSPPLADLLHWMDGHRLIGNSNGTFFVTDYDSTNQQLLVPTNLASGGFFDRSYKYLLTTAPASNVGVSLELVDMRAGVDLPKT